MLEGAINASLRDEQRRQASADDTADSDSEDSDDAAATEDDAAPEAEAYDKDREYEVVVLKSRQPGGHGTPWKFKVKWVSTDPEITWADSWISKKPLGPVALKAWMDKNGGNIEMQGGAYSLLRCSLPYRTVP